LEKLAYGRFSDIGSVVGRKKRGFCGLRIIAGRVRQAPKSSAPAPP
jgi:hypothetical protein